MPLSPYAKMPHRDDTVSPVPNENSVDSAELCHDRPNCDPLPALSRFQNIRLLLSPALLGFYPRKLPASTVL